MDIYADKSLRPMLIKEAAAPFNSPDYIYELKLDGIRCLAYLNETSTDIRSKRNGQLIPRFPELADIHAQVKGKCILDGELIVIKNGAPDFAEVQRRFLINDSQKFIFSGRYPASFVAYDILYINNKLITDQPLLNRKKLLEETVNETVNLAISRYVSERGVELYQLAKKQNLGGVIAKAKTSKYYPEKQTTEWINFNFRPDKDFAVCGYFYNQCGFLCLVLGQYRGGDLIYKGQVSTGLRIDITEEYLCIKSSHSPFYLTPSGNDNIVWLEPTLVCVVQYKPKEKGLLGQPVFKCIREDKSPQDCREIP